MKRLSSLLALMVFLSSAGIYSSSAHTLITITKTKKSDDENRQVSGFKGVSSSGSFDVKITMGDKEALRLEGDKNVISEIETVVENGILKIRSKKKNGLKWQSGRQKVTVYITATSLNSLTLSGSGDVTVEGLVKADKLSNTLSGSGSIRVASADANDYVGTISGSGEITVKGRADRASIQIGGSGDFDGRNLKTSEVKVAVSGSGNVSINAEKTLNAVVSGSGNIRYSGNAKVSQTKSGSGEISRL